jgi:hypothetical protein
MRSYFGNAHELLIPASILFCESEDEDRNSGVVKRRG